MEILVCLNDALFKQLLCLLLNLSQKIKNNNETRIHIIHSNLSRKKINRIYRFSECLSIKIKTYQISDSLCADFPYWGHGSTANYYRLFFSDIVDFQSSKILYLDLDILILSDLSKLYNKDLEDHVIGAHGSDKKNFNSGIMLIDIAKWIDADVPKQTLKIINEENISLTWWDNDILNHIFFGKWKEIGNAWNFMPNYFMDKSISPSIVHFAGASKPWQRGYHLPYSKTYRKNLRKAQRIYLLSSFLKFKSEQ